ncbi:MAG: 30S ribosomal protein S6, partial [bacterium]|nr:30S ribosomal protein S6 [bacterium]
ALVKGRVTTLVTQNAQKLMREEDMGKRKLAYSIKAATFGIYSLVYFEADPRKAKELDNLLRLEDGVIRHLTLACDAVPTQELAAQQAVAQVMQSAPKKVADVPKVATPMPSMEELDKKLGEILQEGSTNL